MNNILNLDCINFSSLSGSVYSCRRRIKIDTQQFSQSQIGQTKDCMTTLNVPTSSQISPQQLLQRAQAHQNNSLTICLYIGCPYIVAIHFENILFIRKCSSARYWLVLMCSCSITFAWYTLYMVYNTNIFDISRHVAKHLFNGF